MLETGRRTLSIFRSSFLIFLNKVELKQKNDCNYHIKRLRITIITISIPYFTCVNTKACAMLKADTCVHFTTRVWARS